MHNAGYGYLAAVEKMRTRIFAPSACILLGQTAISSMT